MRKKYLVIFIVLNLLLISCSISSKLESLNYPQAIVSRIENSDSAKYIIDNKIDYETYRKLINHKNFKKDNLEIYSYLLNKEFTVDELDILVAGSNLYSITKKEVEFLDNKNVYLLFDNIIHIKKLENFENNNLTYYIELIDFYERTNYNKLIVAVNEYISSGNTFNKITSLSNQEALSTLDTYLKPKINIDSKKWEYEKTNDILKYVKKNIEIESPIDNNIEDNLKLENDFKIENLGSKQLEISVTDSEGRTTYFEENISIVDNTPPKLFIGYENRIFQGESISLTEELDATDNYDGDLTEEVKINENEFNRDIPGNYKIEYTVTDSNGNTMKKEKEIDVIETYTKGESFILNDYKLKLNSFWFSKRDSEPVEGYYSYHNSEPNNIFLINSLYIENLDDNSRTPFDTFGDESEMLSAKLLVNGISYDTEYHSLDNNWYDSFNSINAESYKTRRLTFEIPKKYKNNNLKIYIKFYSKGFDTAEIYLKIR